jgi:hypothetical protein
MTRRPALAASLLACALALCACPEERATLAPKTEELLRAKADERIASLLKRPEPSPFAAVVVFRSDVFLNQSALLERSGISLLDSFDNVAVLLLDVVNTPSLLAEDVVRKVRYLCPPRSLTRFHPAFLLSALRAFGNGKEDEPIPFFIRFRNLPAYEEVKAVQDAGFTVRSRDGINLSVSGPPAGLPRLLELDRIIYYEGASNLRTM